MDYGNSYSNAVFPAMKGTVIDVRYHVNCNRCSAWGNGNYVKIDHGNGVVTLYSHLKTDSNKHLKPGDKVTTETKLGIVGGTGNTNGDHLHFGLGIIELDEGEISISQDLWNKKRKENKIKWADPEPFLPKLETPSVAEDFARIPGIELDRITNYNPEERQTDSTPCETGRYNLCDLSKHGVKIIALSRDMLYGFDQCDLARCFHYRDIVEIKNSNKPELNGRYVVLDSTADYSTAAKKRIRKTVDIFQLNAQNNHGLAKGEIKLIANLPRDQESFDNIINHAKKYGAIK